MSHLNPEQYSILCRQSSQEKRLCTICGTMSVPHDVFADGTHVCSKRCAEIKKRNIIHGGFCATQRRSK